MTREYSTPRKLRDLINKLRGGPSYEMDPEDNLFDLGMGEIGKNYIWPKWARKRDEKFSRPHFGKGSGRAGGARSATHKKDHMGKWGIRAVPSECPICRYSLNHWRVWIEHGLDSEEWNALWEWAGFMEGNRPQWEDALERKRLCESLMAANGRSYPDADGDKYWGDAFEKRLNEAGPKVRERYERLCRRYEEQRRLRAEERERVRAERLLNNLVSSEDVCI